MPQKIQKIRARRRHRIAIAMHNAIGGASTKEKNTPLMTFRSSLPNDRTRCLTEAEGHRNVIPFVFLHEMRCRRGRKAQRLAAIPTGRNKAGRLAHVASCVMWRVSRFARENAKTHTKYTSLLWIITVCDYYIWCEKITKKIL